MVSLYEKIRAIAIDLDGTLLDSRKEASPRAVLALMRMHAAGKKIVVATGRPPRSVSAMLPGELLAICGFIYYNGAMVVDEQGALLHEAAIPRELSSAIIGFVAGRDPDAAISLEVRDVAYGNVPKTPEWIGGRTERARRSIEELRMMSPSKILFYGAAHYPDLVSAFGDKVNILLTDGGRLIQIMPEGISKESGIRRWCSVAGISPDSVMVFGDDINDLGMFRLSGHAVAMGNAIDELKAIADEITDTNDRDGVAKVLERMLAEKK